MTKNHISRSDFGSWGGFLGVLGLVCIEKWSRNFDSGIQSAIFDTLKMEKTGYFGHFGGIKNGTSGAPIKILRPLFYTN